MALRNFVFCLFHIVTCISLSADSEQNFPTCSVIINRPCYSLSYDTRTRNAKWVYERITAKSLEGSANRKNLPFKEDPKIPKIFRSTLKDFQGSGFDRGHLAPAANHKISSEDLSDTFFLSNISPQDPQFNRGYWSEFEKKVRDLTKQYEVVEIFTGALFLPEQDEKGNRWVKYQVIGENDVAVPTHFYKILVLRNSQNIQTEAYILPNSPIASKTPLSNFKTTVEKVSKAGGVIFPIVRKN